MFIQFVFHSDTFNQLIPNLYWLCFFVLFAVYALCSSVWSSTASSSWFLCSVCMDYTLANSHVLLHCYANNQTEKEMEEDYMWDMRGREKSGEGKIEAADYRRQNNHLVSLTSAMTERHNMMERQWNSSTDSSGWWHWCGRLWLHGLSSPSLSFLGF